MVIFAVAPAQFQAGAGAARDATAILILTLGIL
jgi:hypothetical protein